MARVMRWVRFKVDVFFAASVFKDFYRWSIESWVIASAGAILVP